MEKVEKNWAALPFAALALATAIALCILLELRGWAVAAGLVLGFCGAFVLWLILYVLVLALISLFLDTEHLPERFEAFPHAMVTHVEGLLPALARVRIHVSGLELLPAGRFLLVGNHRSGFDPLVTGWVLRARQLSFILKPSIRSLPVVGPFVHRSLFLAIDRENDRAALKTILTAAKLMKEDVVSFGVYPEGTRNKGEGLLPFRNGAFKIAQRAKTGVVVAAITGTDEIARRFPWRRTDVYLRFTHYYDAETVAAMNTGDLGEAVRQSILAALA